MITNDELRKLDISALRNEIVLLKKELFNMRLKRGSGQVKDLSQISKLRSSVARAFTVLTEKSKE